MNQASSNEFTAHAQQILNEAEKLAVTREHRYVGTEHLLISLCQNPDKALETVLGDQCRTEDVFKQLGKVCYYTTPDAKWTSSELEFSPNLLLSLKSAKQHALICRLTSQFNAKPETLPSNAEDIEGENSAPQETAIKASESPESDAEKQAPQNSELDLESIQETESAAVKLGYISAIHLLLGIIDREKSVATTILTELVPNIERLREHLMRLAMGNAEIGSLKTN